MKFKNIGYAAFIAATASVIVFGATSARADFNGGGPIVNGGMCWVPTSGNDHGFWKPCPAPERHAHMKKHMKKM